MEKPRQIPATDEIVFGSADTRVSTAISLKVRAGMLDRAQDLTARIDFKDYERALGQLREANAFREPHEGRLRMPERFVTT